MTTERKRFEAWARTYWGISKVSARRSDFWEPDGYEDPCENVAWKAWKAALGIAEEVPYWLCCGSTDPTHRDKRASTCADTENHKFGTKTQHAERKR